MAFYEHLGRAFESVDFLSEMVLRLVKIMVDATPQENNKPSELPDLIKDIARSTMTRCEIIPAVNDTVETDSTLMQNSPVPCESSDTNIALNNDPTWPTNQHRDSVNQDPIDGRHHHCQDRRSTEPAVMFGGQGQGQGELNITLKKPQTPDIFRDHQDFQDHDDNPQMDLIIALRKVGDNLDKKLDRKVKKSMLQSFVNCACQDLPKKTLKTMFDWSLTVVTEYNRL